MTQTKISEYDQNDRLVYRKDFLGKEGWYEYDKDGNLICTKCSDGTKKYQFYNEKGDLTYVKEVKNSKIGTELAYENEYHKNGKLKSVTKYILL